MFRSENASGGNATDSALEICEEGEGYPSASEIVANHQVDDASVSFSRRSDEMNENRVRRVGELRSVGRDLAEDRLSDCAEDRVSWGAGIGRVGEYALWE